MNLASLDVRWILAVGGIVPFLIDLGLAIRKRGPLVFILGCIVVPIYYMIVARYAQEEWGIQYHIYALPFAALGAGIGFDWLLQQLGNKLRINVVVRSPYVWVGAVSLIIMAIWSVQIYKNNLLLPTGESLWECAQSVTKVVPEGSLIIVGTTSRAYENVFQTIMKNPIFSSIVTATAWSLPSDWGTGEQVEQYRKDGASYLIIPYKVMPITLTTYLQDNSVQIGPGIDAGCGIYKFN